MKKILGTAIVLLAGVGAYFYITHIYHTPIGDIIKDPRKYEGKTLTISGKVTDRASLFVVKYFRLEDGTGEIMVVTGRTLPAEGSTVRVKGRVEEAFSIGTEQMLVFVEKAKEDGGGEGEQ